ncbi:hypothetical protein GCM10025868_33370 [Angustibacter aerolatus]|uniref:Uncharacterized protein n=1 Tax=Angustibacter aerolatus TaxID=1162965 RepID=A0ABQ6JJY5_9ACTN|nr:hypothetical protein GCM10025868_33370 [Angustibacter aerolatus]
MRGSVAARVRRRPRVRASSRRLGRRHDAVGRVEPDQVPGVPARLVGRAGQPGAARRHRLQTAEVARHPPLDVGERRVDQHLHLVPPAGAQVRLDGRDGIETGRPLEALVEHPDVAHAVDAQHALRVAGV